MARGGRKGGLGGIGGRGWQESRGGSSVPNLLWVGGFDGGDRDEDNKMLCFGGMISGGKARGEWGSCL